MCCYKIDFVPLISFICWFWKDQTNRKDEPKILYAFLIYPVCPPWPTYVSVLEFIILVTFNAWYCGIQILTVDHVTEQKTCTLHFTQWKGLCISTIEMHGTLWVGLKVQSSVNIPWGSLYDRWAVSRCRLFIKAAGLLASIAQRSVTRRCERKVLLCMPDGSKGHYVIHKFNKAA
jgi:hypothetical protein